MKEFYTQEYLDLRLKICPIMIEYLGKLTDALQGNREIPDLEERIQNYFKNTYDMDMFKYHELLRPIAALHPEGSRLHSTSIQNAALIRELRNKEEEAAGKLLSLAQTKGMNIERANNHELALILSNHYCDLLMNDNPDGTANRKDLYEIILFFRIYYSTEISPKEVFQYGTFGDLSHGVC